MSARFVTFEGLDGSGKSTQLRWAAEWLEEQGQPCCVTHEPGGTPLGQEIRSLFLDSRWGKLDGRVELLLVFASRRQHLMEVIEPALARGQWVLCDRFTDSTMAYQGYGRGVSLDDIETIESVATGGRRPDHTLLLDLSAEAARSRGRSRGRRRQGSVDRLDDEQLDFYRRVRTGFLALAEQEPERIAVVSSEGPRDGTREQVRAWMQRWLEH